MKTVYLIQYIERDLNQPNDWSKSYVASLQEKSIVPKIETTVGDPFLAMAFEDQQLAQELVEWFNIKAHVLDKDFDVKHELVTIEITRELVD